MSDKSVERSRKDSEAWHLKQIGELIEEEGEYVKQMQTTNGAQALWYLTESYKALEDEIAEHRRDIRELHH